MSLVFPCVSVCLNKQARGLQTLLCSADLRQSFCGVLPRVQCQVWFARLNCSSRMSFENQVLAVQQQIEDVLQKVSDTEASLALEKQAGHEAEVRFLRGQLEQLYRTRVALQEMENRLSPAQQGGPRKLTLLQLVDIPSQPFVYARPPSTSSIMPSRHLRHVPDQVLPWLGVEEQACAFKERLPATPAIYDCYMRMTCHPCNEVSALMLLDGTVFSVANQLGNVPGLAAIKFNEFPDGLDLAATPDRVWTCNGKVIGVAEGKQPRSRPALLGHQLVESYNPKKPLARVTAQLQQVCGQLHYSGLKHGVLYTDQCFWFLRYDANSAQGTLYVSEGIMVSGTQPTVLLTLLFVGDLAQQHAAISVPSNTRQQSLPLVLDFLGNLHSLIIKESSPESLPHQLCMGPLLGRGSTGDVSAFGPYWGCGPCCQIV
ncbi:hypothetical protein ABBQ38_004744 [Trebouxia sp. C0009 RCD-2024]